MKTQKVLNCLICAATIVLLLVVMFTTTKHEVVSWTANLGDTYKVVTYQPKNIFGMNLGEEYTVRELID